MNQPAATSYEIADELTGVLGSEAAMRLMAAFGGRALYVPREPGANHPISAVIGQHAAAALGRHFAGGHIEIPVTIAKRQRILQLLGQNKRPLEIANQLTCTTRFVRKVRREQQLGICGRGMVAAERLPDLFD